MGYHPEVTTLNIGPRNITPYSHQKYKYLTLNRLFSLADDSAFAAYAGSSLANAWNKYSNECVAFRIEKTNTQDNTTTNIIIQNQQYGGTNAFGEFNNTNNSFKYVDTQVKYGVPYAYQVYAYFAVFGYKYTYSDLRLSRSISAGYKIGSLIQTDRIPTDFVTTYENYYGAGSLYDTEDERYINKQYDCIEFYDPYTDEASPSPMKTVDRNMEPVRLNLKNYSEYPKYVTEAQELVSREGGFPRYFADFNLSIEPTIRIYQVPIYSKQLTVLDNPPPGIGVVPYQVKNQSQTIGFYIKLENFSTRTMTYPTAVTTEEIEIKANYLTSQNMLDIDTLNFGTVSQPKEVEIYRLSSKPSAMTDFVGSLVETKSIVLNDENSVNHQTYVSTCCFYEEKIATGHKFYYAFRFKNENNIPGPWSPVIQVEMIDDGGYKYAIFDSIIEKDLKTNEGKENPFKQFKKLLMIQPTIPQINMSYTEDIDFSQTAGEQFDNVQIASKVSDRPWNKRYKIRLTSKKTGKKLDLNIKYNVISDAHSAYEEEIVE
jgi:hypothetical protein